MSHMPHTPSLFSCALIFRAGDYFLTLSQTLIKMDKEWQVRTKLLLGETVMASLEKRHVLVVGVGGVGAYAAEMLVRGGVGEITIVDADKVSESNINRQLVALHSTLGMDKTEVLRKRLLDINPELNLHVHAVFLKDELIPQLLDEAHYDFVVDAIDTLSPKVYLIQCAMERRLPLVSSMGAGAKSDITKIQIADISKSYNCTLAKAVRKRLGKLGIKKGFKVVFSSELPDEKAVLMVQEENKVSTVGTISYMPATFGNFIAFHVLSSLSQMALGEE